MATGSTEWTQNGAESHFGGSAPLAWGADTIKLMLLEATFDGATAVFINHASINEIESADTSYPAGGYTLGTKTVVAAAGPIIQLKAADITAPAIPARYTVKATADAAGASWRDLGTLTVERFGPI